MLRTGTPDTAPQPGLEDLDGLLESARSGGVTVTPAISGAARTLPKGVDLSAYRILQEALSNAMRHAPGSAVRVDLAYTPSALVIRVRNEPVTSAAPGAARNGKQPRPLPGHAGNGGGHAADWQDGTGPEAGLSASPAARMSPALGTGPGMASSACANARPCSAATWMRGQLRTVVSWSPPSCPTTRAIRGMPGDCARRDRR